MNLILLQNNDFIDDRRVRLNDRRQQHIQKVHRAKVGDELCVGLVGGKIGTGQIVSLDTQYVELNISLNRRPPAPLAVTLILALPRPKVFNRVISCVTSMGVKKIILINSKRVEQCFWLSRVLQEENLVRQLMYGLEQARDTIMPEIRLFPEFQPFFKNELPEIIKGTMPLLAHPEAPYNNFPNLGGSATLIIGPEGGFIPREVDQFLDIGCQLTSFTERILRVESIIPALLAKLCFS